MLLFRHLEHFNLALLVVKVITFCTTESQKSDNFYFPLLLPIFAFLGQLFPPTGFNPFLKITLSVTHSDFSCNNVT